MPVRFISLPPPSFFYFTLLKSFSSTEVNHWVTQTHHNSQRCRKRLRRSTMSWRLLLGPTSPASASTTSFPLRLRLLLPLLLIDSLLLLFLLWIPHPSSLILPPLSPLLSVISTSIPTSITCLWNWSCCFNYTLYLFNYFASQFQLHHYDLRGLNV